MPNHLSTHRRNRGWALPAGWTLVLTTAKPVTVARGVWRGEKPSLQAVTPGWAALRRQPTGGKVRTSLSITCPQKNPTRLKSLISLENKAVFACQFPAIFPASATLVEKHEREKKRKAGIVNTARSRQAAAPHEILARLCLSTTYLCVDLPDSLLFFDRVFPLCSRFVPSCWATDWRVARTSQEEYRLAARMFGITETVYDGHFDSPKTRRSVHSNWV
jgi:hypothetical protein